MPLNGYNLQNASSQTYLDLNGGYASDGTPIIVYLLNTQPAGTTNQQWRFIPISSSSNLYTVQNVAAGTYAAVEGNAKPKSGITGNAKSALWEVVAIRDPVGYFIIKVPSTNLVWTLDSSNLKTKVTLDDFNGSSSQQWAFKVI